MNDEYLKAMEKHKAETTRLLSHLLPDWTVIGVHDCEEYEKTESIEKAVELATAVDEAHVYIKNGKWQVRLFLVYGNGAGELVSDYSWTKGMSKSLLDALEAKLTEWSDKEAQA